MAAGDYYLQKNNGVNIDEKKFLAISDQVLGFDLNLDPVMISILDVTGLSGLFHNACPKWNDNLKMLVSSTFMENDDTSIQIGNSAIAQSTVTMGSLAIGCGTMGMEGGVAISDGAYAEGQGAISIGYFAVAIGENALALSAYSDAEALGAISIGFSSASYGEYSIGFGYSAKAYGLWAIAFGSNCVAQSSGDIAIGLYANVDTTVSGKSSCLIGVGAQSASRTLTQGNTLAICGDIDGSPFFTGIGTVTPQEALEVVGNIRATERLISGSNSESPIDVKSTIMCDNLNADLLDGYHAAHFAAAAHTHPYDNYEKWSCSAAGSTFHINSENSTGSYRGVEFYAGTGIEISVSSNMSNQLKLTISSTGSASGVSSWNTRTGDVALTKSDVESVLTGVITTHSHSGSSSATTPLIDYPTTSTFTGTGATVTPFTYTMPANTLTADGQKLTINYGGDLSSSAAVTFWFGASGLPITFSGAYTYKIEMMRGSSSTIKYSLTLNYGTSVVNTIGILSGVNFTVSNVIKLTCTLPTGYVLTGKIGNILKTTNA